MLTGIIRFKHVNTPIDFTTIAHRVEVKYAPTGFSLWRESAQTCQLLAWSEPAKDAQRRSPGRQGRSWHPWASNNWVLNEITAALLFQAEMPGNPQGAEEGQGGMQPLSPGEGRSLLHVGSRKGNGTPLPSGGEILCVNRRGKAVDSPSRRALPPRPGLSL